MQDRRSGTGTDALSEGAPGRAVAVVSARAAAAAGLGGAAVAAAVLLLLEARALGKSPTALAIFALDLAILVPVVACFALAAWSGLGVAVARWATAFAVAVAAIGTGLDLAGGGGLARAGLAWLPPVALPLVALLGTWAALRLTGLVARRDRRLAAVLVFSGAVLVRLANFNLYVGLYAPAHDALFAVELGLWALGGAVLAGGRRVAPRSLGALPAVAFLALSIATSWVFPAPLDVPPAAREVMAAGRLHAARFLRMRGGGQDAFRDVALDRDLVSSFARWNEAARETALARLPEDRAWNLVWITVDTLRADRVGCVTGDAAATRTPRIDAFSRNAAVFTRAWAQYPSTHLSVASLFTGRYPRATELYRSLATPPVPGELAEAALVPMLRDAGFFTAAAVAFTEEWMGQPSFRRWLSDFDVLNPELRGRPSLDARWFVDSAKAALDAAGERRFFLWFHIFEPHHPYEAHEGFAFGDDQIGRYDSEVAYADARVGDLLDDLERRGLLERTVVMIGSDHGESLGENGLRYHGSALSVEQLRVPLVIRIPNGEGRRIGRNVGNVDLLETTRTLLRLDPSPPSQGRDLTPMILDGEGVEGWPDVAYSELPDDVKDLSAASANVAALALGEDRLVRHLDLGYDRYEGEGLDASRRERLERTLVTMATWTERFGRSGDALAEASAARAALVAGLRIDDPFARREAVRRASEDPVHDLGPELAALARDPDEFPEIRIAALGGAAAVLGEEGLAELAASDDPALAWAALRTLPLGAATRRPAADEPVALRDELLLHAAAREGDLAGVARARDLVRLGTAAPALRDRAALALCAAGEPEPALAALGEARLARLLAERPDLVERLADRDLAAAYALAMRLAPDRYLRPALRDRFLALTARLPDTPALELGRMLLAGWDPAFHRAATERLGARFGGEAIAAAERARAHEADAEAAPLGENWSAWRAATLRAVETAPPGGGVLRLAVADALSALGTADFGAAAEALDRALAARAQEPLAATDLARVLDELVAHRPREGRLKPDDRVVVVAAAPGEEARRFAVPGQEIPVVVRLRNDADRALVGGTTPFTGRLRVLWSRDGESGPLYGTERALDRGILPGEEEERRMVVAAPERPGAWTGRIIVHQQEGPRFHVHETEGATFGLQVLDPTTAELPSRLEPAELARHARPGPGLADFGQREADGPLEAVALDYRAAFELPALPIAAAGLDVELSWRSAHEDAVRLLVTGGAGGEPRAAAPIGRAGARETVRPRWEGAAPVGPLSLVAGGRPGLLRVFTIAPAR